MYFNSCYYELCKSLRVHIFAKIAVPFDLSGHWLTNPRIGSLLVLNVFRSTCGASWEINVLQSRVNQDFEEACSLLGKAGVIQCCQEEISVTDAGQQTMTFLKTLLQPFMDSYQVTCRHSTH